MCFTLTLIKEIKIFKHVADENCTNYGNGTRFDFLWFGMEGDTCNAFPPPCFPTSSPILVRDFDVCIYVCTYIKICSKIMLLGEGVSELTHRY